jgi:hypothetical protein
MCIYVCNDYMKVTCLLILHVIMYSRDIVFILVGISVHDS